MTSSLPTKQRLTNPLSSSPSSQSSVPSDRDTPADPARRIDPPPAQELIRIAPRHATRSGRRVRFPDRLQGGFS
ncbi:hypothetical protein CAJAP_03934 [Camponotus japonicus]